MKHRWRKDAPDNDDPVLREEKDDADARGKRERREKRNGKGRTWSGEVDNKTYTFTGTGDRKPTPAEMRKIVKRRKLSRPK